MKRGKLRSFIQNGWFLGAVAGLLTGAISGSAITMFRTEPQLADLSVRLAGVATTTTAPTKPEVNIIPIESRPLVTSLPSVFNESRRSPVLSLIDVATADTPITDKQAIGTAIVMTSDGWLITSYESLENKNLSNVRVISGVEVIALEQAVRDQDTNLVYLKITASGLPVADFVQARDVTVGTAVWTERKTSILRPASIMSVRARGVYEAVSSETANRRYLISGGKEDGVAGQPVWDTRARLIGLYERYDAQLGAWLVQPVGSVARDLASLLKTDTITHAGLSISALDLEGIVLAPRPDNLPLSGAWLRPGGRAIAKDSPAFGKLEPGDVIERVERDILDGQGDLGEILLDYRPGATVTLTILRGTEQQKVDLTLAEIQTSVSLMK